MTRLTPSPRRRDQAVRAGSLRRTCASLPHAQAIGEVSAKCSELGPVFGSTGADVPINQTDEYSALEAQS
jgi:hypothetical protein